MKRLTYLFLLIFMAAFARAQDTAPVSPKIFNPSPTFYKSVSSGDTIISAKGSTGWWNLTRESWVEKYFLAKTDSSKFITPYAFQHTNWNFYGTYNFENGVQFLGQITNGTDIAANILLRGDLTAIASENTADKKYAGITPGVLTIQDSTQVGSTTGYYQNFVDANARTGQQNIHWFTGTSLTGVTNIFFPNANGTVALVGNTVQTTPVIGTIYNNDNFTSLTGLNQNGATGSIVGNQLQLGGGTGDYKHTIDIPGGTLLDNWVATVDIVAPTAATGASFGVGVRSTNVNSPTFLFSKIAKLDLSNGANTGQLTLQGGNAGATTLVTAPNKLVITAGDTIRIYINRKNVNITIRATDKSHPQNDVTTTYYTSATNNGLSTLQNTGIFSLFATSTTPVNVVKWNVYSNTPIGADIGLEGDSKLLGGGSTVYANSTAGLLSQYFTVVNQGGSGDCTADIILRLAEVMKLNNHYLIFSAGRNDLVAGISLSTIEANLTTMADTAIAHHIPFYFLTG